MRKELGAWTAPGFEPDYLNFMQTDGEVTVTMRNGMKVSHIEIPKNDFYDLIREATKLLISHGR